MLCIVKNFRLVEEKKENEKKDIKYNNRNNDDISSFNHFTKK